MLGTDTINYFNQLVFSINDLIWLILQEDDDDQMDEDISVTGTNTVAKGTDLLNGMSTFRLYEKTENCKV